jgi:hypothetical protein
MILYLDGPISCSAFSIKDTVLALIIDSSEVPSTAKILIADVILTTSQSLQHLSALTSSFCYDLNFALCKRPLLVYQRDRIEKLYDTYT